MSTQGNLFFDIEAEIESASQSNKIDQQSVMPSEEEFRIMLANIFLTQPIDHGTKFDNNKRWCGVCNQTQPQCNASKIDYWADKMCPNCTAVWPEYVKNFYQAVQTQDEELLERVGNRTIN